MKAGGFLDAGYEVPIRTGYIRLDSVLLVLRTGPLSVAGPGWNGP